MLSQKIDLNDAAGLKLSFVLLSLLAFAVGLPAQTATPETQQSAIRGRVLRGSDDQPLANARVVVFQLRVTGITDSLGRFALDRVPAGTHVVVVKAIGFDSLVTELRVIANSSLDIDFILEKSVQTLAPVTVTEKFGIERLRLQEFNDRRLLGFGKFLDSVGFRRQAASQLDVIIAGAVPGVRARSTNGKMVLSGQRDGKTCYAQIVVNGLVVFAGVPRPSPGSRSLTRPELESFFDVNSLNAHEILAFEWHTPSTTPMKYNATGSGGDGAPCGTAIFWTR